MTTRVFFYPENGTKGQTDETSGLDSSRDGFGTVAAAMRKRQGKQPQTPAK